MFASNDPFGTRPSQADRPLPPLYDGRVAFLRRRVRFPFCS